MLCGTGRKEKLRKKEKNIVLILFSVMVVLHWKLQLWGTSLPSGAHSVLLC